MNMRILLALVLIAGSALVMAPVSVEASAPPPGYSFIPGGTGIAQLSSAQAHSAATSVKLATVTTTDRGMVRFAYAPGTLKLDDLTALSYWEYVAARDNPLDVFIDIWLDFDNNGIADASDYPGYMQAEPYYTVGAAPLNTWTQINAMTLKWSTYVGPDDPYNAPTIADFQANTSVSAWTNGVDFGQLYILRVDVRVGYGGTWTNFTGYADDIQINDYLQGFDTGIPTIKAGMKARNLTGNNNGYDVALGTDTDFQPPSVPPTGFVLYDSSSSFPWVLNGANPITFLYDTTKLDATFPINTGTGTGSLTWASGNLGLLNYLQVSVVCRAAGTTVSFTGVTVNGNPLPNFIPPACGGGGDWYTWYVTGIDMTAGFNIAGTINLTGPSQDGQETNKVEILVGSIPALTATTTDPLICTGESTTVNIDLAEVVGLYGYQFQVSYDPAKASASGAFVYSFFDVDGDGAVPGGTDGPWDAKCSAGTCSFARTELGPDPAVSGSGTLAQITLTGVAPGTFNMTISNDVLSDIDGAALPHSLGAPLPITVCGLASVSGYVTLQGRPGNNVDAGTVTLTEQAPTYFAGPYSGAFSATNGTYTINNVPYMPGGSSYKILAEHGLYLDNEDTITVSGNLANKNTRLWGGDANNGGKVGIADLACIGGAFDVVPVSSTCSGTGSPDINADGKVNIQDLSLAGGNYDKCSPEPWDWVSGLPNTTCPGAS